MSVSKESIAIEIKDIKKHFKEVKAVDGVSLKIRKGELFSILGPNGAGKTTLVRMLTTILTPTAGDANVNGHSILTGKKEIVKKIGVCPQVITIYEVLKAEENVEFIAIMHGMTRKEAKEKTRKILEDFGIAGRKDWSKRFSGGMQRRLNLAMSLVFEPEILFLDEPTAGLDPQARRLVWDYIRDLKNRDITIILMTHDMVEADSLSDRIAFIDQGKIIAEGTPTELKEKYGSDNALEVSFLEQEDLEIIRDNIKNIPFVVNWNESSRKERNTLLISFQGGLKNLMKLLQQGFIDSIDEVENIKFRQNSLEDVFLNLTGKRLRD
ncbi:MAG TPA: ATP-binding cassette domain-containing protein [Candidatus Nanopelagicaceae bacterium]|nr:ATP-binding cassette domain-containing protein [Candidatus Nanopelagicaceae bacterium]